MYRAQTVGDTSSQEKHCKVDPIAAKKVFTKQKKGEACVLWDVIGIPFLSFFFDDKNCI